MMNARQKRSQSLKLYWRSAVERRNKMSIGMKGENNPAKLSAVRIKISDNKRGKHWKHIHPLSEKQKLHLLRLSGLRKGKAHSLGTRMKISVSRKGKCAGQKNPFYGRKHSRITIEQIKTNRQFNRERHLRDVLNKANGFEAGIVGHPDEVYITKPYQKIDPLGYLIGTIPTDGYFDIPPKKSRYVYSISAKDKDFIETAAECLFSVYGFAPNINKQRNLWRIQTSKKQIGYFAKFLKKENRNQWLFNEDAFYSLNDNFRRSILMSVCDAEGRVTNAASKNNITSRRITVTNTSLLLLKQVKLLFKLFGIVSYIYHHRDPRITQIRNKSYQFKKHVYVLIITGRQNLQKFNDIIGFAIKRKQKKLDHILRSYKKFERCYTQIEYNRVLNLSKHFTNYCDISRIANISSAIVRNWVLYHRKPRSVKMLQAI